jgi:hypothetical protein
MSHHWNKHPYHYRRFNPLMLIVPVLFLVFFGGFILKMLLWVIPFLLIAWGVSKVVGHHRREGYYHYDPSEKLKNDDYEEEKRKVRYVQAEDGQWVEII